MGYSISNRVFGSDIPKPIKQKLALRQALAKSPDVNETIDAIFDNPDQYGDIHPPLNINFDGIADLSSRTPFARMWVAIMLESDQSTEHESANFNEPEPLMPDEERQKTDWAAHKVVYFWKDGKIYYRKFAKSKQKVYMVGNNTLNTLQVQPNETLTGDDVLIPDEQQTDSNEFFAPPAGITSVSSETEGPLGAIKKTTINFIIHNFADFETIYSRYFLRHGAQIFVDFGWDSQMDDLYNPEEALKRNELEEFEDDLFGEDGAVTKSYGDMDTIVGYVTNYDAKIKENGSVECTIDLSSKNAVLLNHNIGGDDSLRRRIKMSLDIESLRFAAKSFGAEESESMMEKSSQWHLSADNKEKWEEFFFQWGEKFISSDTIMPPANAVEVGVYYGVKGKDKALFVSWGFFEDKILNNNFGFGDDDSENSGGILDQKDLKMQPKFDSSRTFIRYNANLLKSQQASKEISKLKWLYPGNWDSTYNTKRKGFLQDRAAKYPFKYTPSEGEPTEYTITKFDQALDHIPLRELFISTEMIKSAIGAAKSTLEFVKTICSDINHSTRNIFDFQIGNNAAANHKICIVDRNLVNDEHGKDKKDFIENLFTFHPMSPNTIVKNYDISFTTPQGNMQNMIALQTAGPGGQLFAVDGMTDRLIANEAVLGQTSETDEVSGKLIRRAATYLPRTGGYRFDRYKKENNPGGVALDFYSDAELFSDKNTQTDSLLNSFNLSKAGLNYPDEAKVEESKTESPDTDTETSVELERLRGKAVATDLSDYYLMLARKENFESHISSLLFSTLTLEIYGISAIAPGDIFAVDYLPKKYRDQVYFQVQSVSHDISTSTWTTTLETTMRFHKGWKKDYRIYEEISGVILAKNFLTTIGLSFWYGTGEDLYPWPGGKSDIDKLPGRDAHDLGQKFHIDNLLSYIQDLEVIKLDTTIEYLEYAFRFTAQKKGTVYIPGSKQHDCSETETSLVYSSGLQVMVPQNTTTHKRQPAGYPYAGAFDWKADLVKDNKYILVVHKDHIANEGRAWSILPAGGQYDINLWDIDIYGECEEI